MATRSIYIVGASSTGKTTLCRALEKELGMPLITEVARTVMKEKQFTRSDVATTAMQEAIFHAQVAAQKEALENHHLLWAIGQR